MKLSKATQMIGLMSTPPTGLMIFLVGPNMGSVGLYATAQGILLPGICIASTTHLHPVQSTMCHSATAQNWPNPYLISGPGHISISMSPQHALPRAGSRHFVQTYLLPSRLSCHPKKCMTSSRVTPTHEATAKLCLLTHVSLQAIHTHDVWHSLVKFL